MLWTTEPKRNRGTLILPKAMFSTSNRIAKGLLRPKLSVRPFSKTIHWLLKLLAHLIKIQISSAQNHLILELFKLQRQDQPPVIRLDSKILTTVLYSNHRPLPSQSRERRIHTTVMYSVTQSPKMLVASVLEGGTRELRTFSEKPRRNLINLHRTVWYKQPKRRLSM